MMTTRISVVLLALALAACEPRQPQEVPAPPPSPDNPAAAPTPTPDGTPTAPASPSADPTTSPAAPAQPAPTAPAPTDPSAAPKPTAAAAAPGPALDSMALARPGAKMSVAVDLRYQFDGAVVDGKAATLHLAAISRVDGSHLNVQVKPAEGLDVSRGTLSAQKVDAAGVYRQQYSVTRHAGGAGNLRVLVTMDMPEGTAFGYFTIPLDGGNTAQKSDSVKQR